MEPELTEDLTASWKKSWVQLQQGLHQGIYKTYQLDAVTWPTWYPHALHNPPFCCFQILLTFNMQSRYNSCLPLPANSLQKNQSFHLTKLH